jgi:hypothetical protein
LVLHVLADTERSVPCARRDDRAGLVKATSDGAMQRIEALMDALSKRFHSSAEISANYFHVIGETSLRFADCFLNKKTSLLTKTSFDLLELVTKTTSLLTKTSVELLTKSSFDLFDLGLIIILLNPPGWFALVGQIEVDHDALLHGFCIIHNSHRFAGAFGIFENAATHRLENGMDHVVVVVGVLACSCRKSCCLVRLLINERRNGLRLFLGAGAMVIKLKEKKVVRRAREKWTLAVFVAVFGV